MKPVCDSASPVLFPKILPFPLEQIESITRALEGRIAIVTDAKAGCGGRGSDGRAPLWPPSSPSAFLQRLMQRVQCALKRGFKVGLRLFLTVFVV